ncbi:MAG: transposase [Eubacteriales bacterium]|nr:transposase [Eubacteriales bacterium]
MSNSRRKYDEEFKKRAVRMSYNSELTVTQMAASLGVTSNMIYRWRKKYTPDGDKTQMARQNEELGQLRHRIAELEEENYILKKASTENVKKELVLQTLKATQERWRLPAGVIFHSDRGSQYTSDEVMKQVANYGWKQSFSRVGKPGDNAWSESFFSILKKEIVH